MPPHLQHRKAPGNRVAQGTPCTCLCSSSKCTRGLISAVCMAISSLPEHSISRRVYSANQRALLQEWLWSLGTKVINQNGVFILLILTWESPIGHFLSLFYAVLNNLPGWDRYDGKIQESEPHFKYLRPQTPEPNNLQDGGNTKRCAAVKQRKSDSGGWQENEQGTMK